MGFEKGKDLENIQIYDDGTKERHFCHLIYLNSGV